MNGKMPVSALQELVAARGHPLPCYQEEGFGTSFKCTVFVEGIKAVGHGTSKKGAKHDCAKNALETLQLPNQQYIKVNETAVVEQPLKNYVGDLNEYSSKNGLQYPDYQFVTALVGGQFVFKCIFLGNETQGVGLNKKDAKQIAAKNMLKLVEAGNNNIIKSDYKVMKQTTALETCDINHIIDQYNQLSLNKQALRPQSDTNLDSSLEIKVEETDSTEKEYNSIDLLEKKLRELKIDFTVKKFQKEPCIVALIIKNTNFTFLATGDNTEDALKKVYNDLLVCIRSGCLNDNLTSFI